MSEPDVQLPIISVVIPARNEEQALAELLPEIPQWVDHVIVVDNGSTDKTMAVAKGNGAYTVQVRVAGYGRACLAGIEAAKTFNSDIIVFLDGDRSDYPAQMCDLVEPVLLGSSDMVIGSRMRGTILPGALTPQQYFGNSLACYLVRLFWGFRYTDLGPFRAISMRALETLSMQSPTFGWTIEMQIKALQYGLNVAEVPVDYRKRIGKSKISGTVHGVVLAGYYILTTIFRAGLRDLIKRRKTGLISLSPIPGSHIKYQMLQRQKP